MTTLIKNGTIYYKDTFRKLDILIEDKIITEVGEKLDADAERVIDAEGKHVFSGILRPAQPPARPGPDLQGRYRQRYPRRGEGRFHHRLRHGEHGADCR